MYKQRSALQYFEMLSLLIVLYYLPLYLQAMWYNTIYNWMLGSLIVTVLYSFLCTINVVHYNIYLDVEFTHCTLLYHSLCTINVIQYSIYLDVEFAHCTVLFPSSCTNNVILHYNTIYI